MEPFAELLARIDADITELSVDELVEAGEQIVTYGQELRASSVDAEDVDQLLEDARTLTAALGEITAEIDRRETETTDAETARAEAFAAFGDTTEETETEDDTEPDTEDQPATEVVTASRPSLADIAARRPRTAAPLTDTEPVAIVAAAAGGGPTMMGAQFGTAADVYDALFTGRRNLTNGRHAIARIPINTGHMLDSNPVDNWATLREVSRGTQVAAQEGVPLVAAGFCAPAQPVYDFFSISSMDGMISLPETNAARGRVTYPEIIDLPSLLPEVAIGAEYTDTDDENEVNKAVYTVDCGSDRTFSVSAWVTRIRYSNFDQLFHPERVAHVTQEVLKTAAHQVNNELILDIVGAGDTTTVINGDTGGGTWVEVVRALAWHRAYIVNHWRMPLGTIMDVPIPAWVISALVADQVARDSTTTYVQALGDLTAALARVGVNVQWVYDWQEPVNAGTFPTTFDFLMYPSGTVVKLVGGTLDLGVTRDSVLNTTNDFELFVETFEGIAIVGPGVFVVTGTEVCPTGATGVREAIACVAGS